MSTRRIAAFIAVLLSTLAVNPTPASAHGVCTAEARLSLGKYVYGFGTITCTSTESICVMTVTLERDGLDQATETFIYDACRSVSRWVRLECPPLMLAAYRVRVDWFVGDVHGGAVNSGQPVTFLCPLI